MQLVLQHCCKMSWIVMLRVLPPTSNLSCNNVLQQCCKTSWTFSLCYIAEKSKIIIIKLRKYRQFNISFLVALGSDYSGAFRSEEDLRAMDDDIRKWYNVGNLFSKKIHLFSSFHLRLSKEVRRLSPPNVSVLLLRVFNRS